MSREIKFRHWDGKKYIHNVVVGHFNCPPVEQFTGLKDKSGKEIYEGDIVKGMWLDQDVDEMLIAEIKIENACVYPFTEAVGESSGYLYGTSISPSDFEIIGNIHENPELLVGNPL